MRKTFQAPEEFNQIYISIKIEKITSEYSIQYASSEYQNY